MATVENNVKVTFKDRSIDLWEILKGDYEISGPFMRAQSAQRKASIEKDPNKVRELHALLGEEMQKAIDALIELSPEYRYFSKGFAMEDHARFMGTWAESGVAANAELSQEDKAGFSQPG